MILYKNWRKHNESCNCLPTVTWGQHSIRHDVSPVTVEERPGNVSVGITQTKWGQGVWSTSSSQSGSVLLEMETDETPLVPATNCEDWVGMHVMWSRCIMGNVGLCFRTSTSGLITALGSYMFELQINFLWRLLDLLAQIDSDWFIPRRSQLIWSLILFLWNAMWLCSDVT